MDNCRNDVFRSPPRSAAGRRARRGLAVALLCGVMSGCAALTNPVAVGIPVRDVPPELLGEPQAGEHPTPLYLLRRPSSDAYRLAPGDVVGVWIEGLLGPKMVTQYPPIHIPQRALPPERGELPLSLGIPFPVREDGTLLLPLVQPVPVQGMTVPEAQEAIRKAYTVTQQILQPDEGSRILASLIQPRRTRVQVFRHDILLNAFNATLNNNYVVTDVGILGGGTQLVGGSNTGAGYLADLPADDNDVLTALAMTGGFPGTNAAREVLIYRAYSKGDPDREALRRQFEAVRPGCAPPGGGQIVRIPLRLRPGEEPAFRPEDVVLHTGDMVFVEARPVCTFYTAGLIPPGEYVLPRDYDLDVVKAVARVRGPLVNGAFAQSNLNGNIIPRGIGSPSPSLLSVLRQTPDGGQVTIRVNLNRALRDPRESLLVRPGDVLVLQETPGQALVRYFTQTFNFTLISRIIQTDRTTGTTTLSVP
jgi:hypothetical protein